MTTSGFGFLKQLALSTATSIRGIAASGLQAVKQQKDYFTGETTQQSGAQAGQMSEAKIREKIASQNENEIFDGLRALLNVSVIQSINRTDAFGGQGDIIMVSRCCHMPSQAI